MCAMRPLIHYSRDRRGEHPVEHLPSRILDVYAGYNGLYVPGRVTEAASRRSFSTRRHRVKRRGKNATDLADGAGGGEADRRSEFDIEREINGASAERRLGVRDLADLKDLDAGLRARKTVAPSMDYMTEAMGAVRPLPEDGRTDDITR